MITELRGAAPIAGLQLEYSLAALLIIIVRGTPQEMAAALL